MSGFVYLRSRGGSFEYGVAPWICPEDALAQTSFTLQSSEVVLNVWIFGPPQGLPQESGPLSPRVYDLIDETFTIRTTLQGHALAEESIESIAVVVMAGQAVLYPPGK
jgi:hypothetical protein